MTLTVQELERMLFERGIDNAADVVCEASPAGVFGAIAWYDAERTWRGPKVGPGLLVHVIRRGGKPGYQPAGDPAPRPSPRREHPADARARELGLLEERFAREEATG